ncbi:MAG TPA: hypothetical protein VHJ20_09595 [Polyangia bacterium]|nr:hypothetical protein [Polyangia bacterium]
MPAALALGGTEWRWERTRVELSLGLGLSKGPVYSTTIQTSSTGGSETNQTISETINDGWQPYARTAVTVSRALSTRWEILARLDAQETFGGAADPTAAAMFGLRRNLP